MVFILVEHLLSTSSNRMLYESLWNLAINKNSKIEKQLKDGDLSISVICNQLLRDINQDVLNRSKFYFSIQLCYGAVLLYRSQIDKLYGQVKMALQTSNVTFYDIHWLSQLDVEPSDFFAESLAGSKVKEPKKRNLKQKQNDDIDLIEQAFTIIEEPVKKKNAKTRKSNDKSNEVDATMAPNLKCITMIDNSAQGNAPDRDFNTNEDDFGAEFPNDFELSFHLPDVPVTTLPPIDHNDQEVPQFKETDEDETTNKIISKDYEKTLAEDVIDIVSKQRSHRKRRGSDEVNIATRLDASKKRRLTAVEDLNDNVQTSPFDINANEPEALNDSSPVILNSTFAVPHQEVLATNSSELASSKLSPVKVTRKSRKKQKLIIDKNIKIKDEALMKEREVYQQKFTILPPLETFLGRMQSIKDSIENFLLLPASRINKYSDKLMPAYQRNLKKISAQTLKRRREFDDEEEAESLSNSPAKRQLRNVPVVFYADNEAQEDPAIQTSISGIEPIINDKSSVLDELHLSPIPFNEAQYPENISPLIKPAKKPNKEYQERIKDSNEIDCYCESDRWSKQKIMKNLTEFWNQNQEAVTMPRLARKSNRFVAAGIFFELMVLSKTGAVELVQGEKLEICNILPGHLANQYV